MPLTPWDRLTRRVSSMHTMWRAATGDLTTAQMNFKEREGVLPIAFSLLHYVGGEDRNVSTYLLGEPMLWESGGWEERIGGKLPSVKRGTSIVVAEETRFGGAEAWLAYQEAVFERTERALHMASDQDYDRIIHGTIPEQLVGSFVDLTYAPGPVALGDIIDGFVFQHGIRHLGEIEHGRSLLGLRGVS
ncbi:MAG: DinB family protein [Thermomicrobiales bacterium]